MVLYATILKTPNFINFTYSKSKATHMTSDRFNNNDNNVTVHVSNFFLPSKKKKILFLRAPYKNKLARLAVMNNQYKTIVIFKTKKFRSFLENKEITPYYMILKIIDHIKCFNISFIKLKHVNTSMKITTFNQKNFFIKNFI